MSNGNTPDHSTVEFSHLVLANQGRIYGFILSLVHNRNAAYDLLQDVNALLWSKNESFELGTDFAAWALKSARFTVLNWQRKQKRLPLLLDEEQLATLTPIAFKLDLEFEGRATALRKCLAGLGSDDRGLLRRRYEQNQSVEQIACELGLSRGAIYKRLNRIHSSLFKCINYQVALGDA